MVALVNPRFPRMRDSPVPEVDPPIPQLTTVLVRFCSIRRLSKFSLGGNDGKPPSFAVRPFAVYGRNGQGNKLFSPTVILSPNNAIRLVSAENAFELAKKTKLAPKIKDLRTNIEMILKFTDIVINKISYCACVIVFD